MANVTVKKRKLNIKAFMILLLIIFLIVSLFYTVISLPIKNIYIKNTKLLTDNDVIEAAGIKDYPAIFKLNLKSLEKKILSLDLVDTVSIKRSFTGVLTITIDEVVPLFYNRNTNLVMLSNKMEITSGRVFGIPSLVNYVPTDMLNSFCDVFANIDPDIIAMINEIEYKPDISGDIIIDDNRFLLRMNDGNHVYVNVLNMKRLNDYKDILMTLDDTLGTLYLDSYNSENSLFTAFSSDSGEGYAED